MTEPNRCDRCGNVLPTTSALGSRCPRCLLEQELETASQVSEDPDSTLTTSHPAQGNDVHLSAPSRPPAAIGRYRIVRLIGEGGMGSVYEAEQEQPRRKVALKVIKPGLVSPELLRRFEQESQALGRLQHPGIAQIYEAGTANTGLGPQPYFAMEFIQGETLVDHANRHHLNTRERLEIA